MTIASLRISRKGLDENGRLTIFTSMGRRQPLDIVLVLRLELDSKHKITLP